MWRSGSLTGLGEDEDNCMARAWSLQKREEIKEIANKEIIKIDDED